MDTHMNTHMDTDKPMNTDTNMDTNKQCFVYLLESSIKGATYVGATIDLNRRLRQHNKEIKGGANYTGSKVSNGETWRRVCYVSGFPDWRTALQFEWRWKQLSRKIDKRLFKKPLEKRMEALKILLSLDKPTNSAIPYEEWVTKPFITYE